IMITGFGFGIEDQGDIPQIRSRKDGFFTMKIPSNHGYVLGVIDQEWVSEPWTGLIRKTDESEPAKVTISASHATPITVRVTEGQNKKPARNVFVNLHKSKNFQWISADGKKQRAMGSIGGRFKTDADGIVRSGVGRGEVEIHAGLGLQSEKKTIQVDSDKPV